MCKQNKEQACSAKTSGKRNYIYSHFVLSFLRIFVTWKFYIAFYFRWNISVNGQLNFIENVNSHHEQRLERRDIAGFGGEKTWQYSGIILFTILDKMVDIYIVMPRHIKYKRNSLICSHFNHSKMFSWCHLIFTLTDNSQKGMSGANMLEK